MNIYQPSSSSHGKRGLIIGFLLLAIGAIVLVATILSLAGLRSICRDRPIPDEVVIGGVPEAVQIQAEFSLLPLGARCVYSNQLDPTIRVIVDDGWGRTVTLSAGLIGILGGSLLLSRSRRASFTREAANGGLPRKDERDENR